MLEESILGLSRAANENFQIQVTIWKLNNPKADLNQAQLDRLFVTNDYESLAQIKVDESQQGAE